MAIFRNVKLEKHLLKQYKQEHIRRKLAILRIARNPIVNHYLLKRVYIPRLGSLLI